MKHYFYPVSRGATTAWMLKELDVPHEAIVIDMPNGEQNSPEYRAINPMGKVPALVDGDVVAVAGFVELGPGAAIGGDAVGILGGVEGVRDGHAAAVLAASIFHFGSHSIGEAKAHMAAAGVPVRPVA